MQLMVRMIDPISKEIRGYDYYIGRPKIGQSNTISFAVFNREEVSQYVRLVLVQRTEIVLPVTI